MSGTQAVMNGRRRTAAAMLGRNWAFFFLVVMIAVFSFTGKNFLTLSNLQTILYSATIAFLLASAETFVIISRGIDLSVGYIMGLSSMAAAGVIRDLWATQYGVMLPAPVAAAVGIIAGLAAAVACGVLNGTLIAYFRVPPFIATLGTLGISYGVTQFIGNGPFAIGFLPPQFVQIGSGYLYYYNPALHASRLLLPPAGTLATQIRDLVRVFPNSLVLTIVVVAALWHLLKNTRFGLHTYAIGGSMDAAVRAGIDAKRHLLWVYILSALLAGLAGLVNMFQTGLGNFTPMDANWELFAIAAVIIGGASLNGGKGRIISSVVGVLILEVLKNGLTLSGLETFYRFIATGVILIAAVVIDQLFPDLF